jgi:hypothetical protein
MRRHLALQLREVAEIRDLLTLRTQGNAARAAQALRDQEVVRNEAEQDLDACHDGWQSAMSDPRRMTDIAAAWAQAVTLQAQTVILEQARLIEAQEECERQTRGWYMAQLLRDDSKKRSRIAASQMVRLMDEAALSEIADRHAGKGPRA